MAEYPKALYHKDLPPRAVNSLEEEKALGPEWKGSPADHEAKPESLTTSETTEKPRKK